MIVKLTKEELQEYNDNEWHNRHGANVLMLAKIYKRNKGINAERIVKVVEAINTIHDYEACINQNNYKLRTDINNMLIDKMGITFN